MNITKKSKKKQAVWKDTNKYVFSIRYDYPLCVRNRCYFFWASACKGWKAVIKLANNLTDGNRVCVVYLYGGIKHETLKSHIQKLNNDNLIILWADYIDAESFEIINAAENAIKRFKGFGAIKSMSEESPFEIVISDGFKQTLPFYPNETKAINDGKVKLLSLKEIILRNGYAVFGRNITISGTESSHKNELIEIIKTLYPYGAETDTNKELAYKLIMFRKYLHDGLKGNTTSAESALGVTYDDETKEKQYSFFDDTSQGIVEFVNMFRKTIDDGILKRGAVDLRNVLYIMSQKPFGMYECNYYGLCLGIALNKYQNGYYLGDSVISRNIENVDYSETIKFIFSTEGTHRIRPMIIYAQSSKQKRFAQRLGKMFGDENCERIDEAIHAGRRWCTDNILYDTVQRLDNKLFEILNSWCLECYENHTEEWDDWLTEDKITELTEGLKNIDKNFLESIAKKYGDEKSRLFSKWAYIKGGAVGWLHDKEMVDEKVERYMNQVICRECGNTISVYAYEVYENSEINRQTGRFTKQNILNLNKKFLGRYQEEYLCIPCLSKFLEISEWELYEKMQEFKVQGCTLF